MAYWKSSSKVYLSEVLLPSRTRSCGFITQHHGEHADQGKTRRSRRQSGRNYKPPWRSLLLSFPGELHLLLHEGDVGFDREEIRPLKKLREVEPHASRDGDEDRGSHNDQSQFHIRGPPFAAPSSFVGLPCLGASIDHNMRGNHEEVLVFVIRACVHSRRSLI